MKAYVIGAVITIAALTPAPASAQDAGKIDKLCLDAAIRSPANTNSRIADARVLRDAPAGFDKNNFPAFLRIVELDIDVGSMKLTRIFRCQGNITGVQAFPYDIR